MDAAAPAHAPSAPGFIGAIAEEPGEGEDDEWGRALVCPTCVPTAFSHWSFASTGGEMVVDLQGEYDPTRRRFRLTDPCVLSDRTEYGRGGRGGAGPDRYGRTDRGRRGILDFFATHECNDLCRALGLEARGDAGIAAQLADRRRLQVDAEIRAALDDGDWEAAPARRRHVSSGVNHHEGCSASGV